MPLTGNVNGSQRAASSRGKPEKRIWERIYAVVDSIENLAPELHPALSLAACGGDDGMRARMPEPTEVSDGSESRRCRFHDPTDASEPSDATDPTDSLPVPTADPADPTDSSTADYEVIECGQELPTVEVVQALNAGGSPADGHLSI